jgi:hypothetical protein
LAGLVSFSAVGLGAPGLLLQPASSERLKKNAAVNKQIFVLILQIKGPEVNGSVKQAQLLNILTH